MTNEDLAISESKNLENANLKIRRYTNSLQKCKAWEIFISSEILIFPLLRSRVQSAQCA